MTILIFFVAHWYLSLFVQTFFLHRYAAHQQFTMSPFMEKVFYVLTFLFQGSSYLSPKAYGHMHRLHHVYADTEQDVHSPKYSTGPIDMMMQAWKSYAAILHDPHADEKPYGKNLPSWDSFDRFADHTLVRASWGIFYTLFYIKFATAPWQFLLLPIHYLMGPVHGVIINWCAHKYGYVTYKVADTSKNFLPFDFLMMGESYHNNHHPYPNDLNFGKKWFEVDFTYLISRGFSAVGLIKIKNQT